MSTVLGEAVRGRVICVIERFGEDLSIHFGGSSIRTVRAQVDSLSTSRRYQWFTAAEAVGWTLPAIVVRIGGDDAAVIGDTFTRDGRTFAVKKIEKNRIGGVVVQTVLMCA